MVDGAQTGYRYIDTAAGYNNEETVGKAIKVRRKRFTSGTYRTFEHVRIQLHCTY